MIVGAWYLFTSSTNCWIRQGTAKKVTCVAQASFVDTDYITITVSRASVVVSTVVYEFDKAGNGVTAGRVQVNISTDTTAATCAARLRTAILANQPSLEVVDNLDGSLMVVAPDQHMDIAETVANAGFLVAADVVTTTAADGSMFIPAAMQVLLSGDMGPQLGVLRSTVDGLASLTRARV